MSNKIKELRNKIEDKREIQNVYYNEAFELEQRGDELNNEILDLEMELEELQNA